MKNIISIKFKFQMNTVCRVYLALLVLSVVNARPSSVEITTEKLADNPNSKNLHDMNVSIQPVTEITAKNYKALLTIDEGAIKKRSVEDLETAAGTNVLRPLFVYRQQLAYREKVKAKRAGFRPGF